MKKYLILIGLLAFSTQSFATSFGCTHHFFAQLNFSKHAWGKQVAGVYAHVGSLQQRSAGNGSGHYWADTQHIRMQDKGGNFFARAEIKGTSAYENTYNRGAVVQYWVYFADGSRKIVDTKPIIIGPSYSFNDRRQEYEALLGRTRMLFRGLKNADKTQATQIKYCWVS